MEKKSLWPVFRGFIFLIQLFAQSLCTTLVLRLNILPDVYVVLLLCGMVMLATCTGLLVFLNVHGRIALWRKIFSAVLALIIVVACIFGFKLALDFRKVVKDVTTTVPDTRKTYIVVLKDDSAQSVKATKGYRYGVLEAYDEEHTQQMLAYIKQETGENPNITYYGQTTLMVDELLTGKVDALIMNGVSITLLSEQPGYETFESQVRILHSLAYENVKQPEPDKTPESVRDPFVLYISGSDTRNFYLTGGLSDVNIIAVVNPNTKQILLVNTPRDYYIPNPAGKGALDKLTHCANYGVECSMEALGTLYDTEIDYYGRINFVGFKRLIDAVDGVTVEADHAFTAITGDYFQKGENTLNGEKALAFARERKNVHGGDNGRGKNQMKVIKAVVDKLSSSKTLIANYSNILKSIEGMFATNFTPDEISDLVKMQMENMTSWNIHSIAVDGTGGYAETYSWKGQELYVTWPNQNSVTFVQDLIDRVIGGEILAAEDVIMPK